MEIHDISRTLRRGIARWPGDPEFRHRWAMRVRDGESSNVSAIDLCVHTGTHVDAPLHLDDAGSDVTRIDVSAFVGPARVVAIASETSIQLSDLSVLDWTGVKRVLFKTRNSTVPEDHFDEHFVCLMEDAARFLVGKGIVLVGTDGPSVDALSSADMPSHRILLRHGIAILEWARLDSVQPGDYELVCLPLKLDGLDGSPVRAILRR